ncbi:DUF3558 family protein [Actinokineospora terrae]|nr:DUF3558 family protein [Actinokineospora terrae]
MPTEVRTWPATPSATPPTSSGSSPVPSASIKACSLLSASDIRALAISTEGEEQETKTRSSCLWRVEKPLAADSYSIDVTFYKERAVGDLVTEHERTPVQVGGRRGVKALGDMDSGCIVALEVTAKSRVDVRAIGRNSAALCEPAMAVAEKVEARLP